MNPFDPALLLLVCRSVFKLNPLRLPLFLLVCFSLSACNAPPKTVRPSPQPIKGGLSFNQLVLKQTDQQGRLVWQLQTKSANYTQDRKRVQVKGLEGELFQAGKATFKLKAPQAEVQEQGDQLVLRGAIVVTDLVSKGVFTAREFEWQPQTDTLLARNQPRLQYAQVQITAREMRANRQTQVISARGQVVADSPRSKLRLLTQQLEWRTEGDEILAGGTGSAAGVVVQRLSPTATETADRAEGGQARYNLKTQTVILQSPAQIRLAKPDLQINGEQFTWQIAQQQVFSGGPLEVRSASQGVTVRAAQGAMNLADQQVELKGGVKAIGERHQSMLQTDQLIWRLPKEEITAQGNVFYRQQKPPLTVRGNRAIGNLQDQEVTVTGGTVTQIIP